MQPAQKINLCRFFVATPPNFTRFEQEYYWQGYRELVNP